MVIRRCPPRTLQPRRSPLWATEWLWQSRLANPGYATLVTNKALVSASELKEAVTSGTSPVLLDCTWFMPNVPRNARQEFQASRIPGSRFFDLDDIIDKSSPYPHMLPSPEDFAKSVGELGITAKDPVCCYDTHGIFSAPRVWWTFKVFGHAAVSVLNGGFPAWKRGGGHIEEGPPEKISHTAYPVPRKNLNLIRTFDQITEIVKKRNKSVQIIDARSSGRFHGVDSEPRKGLSSGHIPGSISMPFQEFINPETGEFYDAEHIRKLMAELDPSKEIITSCGTGVTASILYLALEAIGFQSKSVYDGSWTEYASRHANSPDMIVKG